MLECKKQNAVQYGVSVVKFYDKADYYSIFKSNYNSLYHNLWSEKSSAKEL